MKKRYLLILPLLFISFSLLAQLSNGGFESWKPYPDDQGLNLWRGPQDQNNISGQGEKFELYKLQPCFLWLGDWIPAPQSTVADYVKQAAGKVLPLCIYGYPRTNYSIGGFDSLTKYKNWIDAISNGIGSGPCLLVLEPDALALQIKMADGTSPETALLYAVNKFKSNNTNTSVFIDASHWIDPFTQSSRLRAAGIANAMGFITNVANFRTTVEMVAYCERVNAQLTSDGVSGRKYMIDTGRNGNGPLTTAFGPAAQPWLSHNEDWLNPPGRGLGTSPRFHPDPSRPSYFACVWVKLPGSSDGNDPGKTWTSPYFSSPAPNAGGYWLEWIKDCLDHTNMSDLQ
jgi:endoglucanase